MSELKAVKQSDVMWGHWFTEYYLKSEADKVIAELKKEKEYVIEQTAEVINGQEEELRHHKYKRCLAMAKLCHWKMGVFIYKEEKSNFYHRWFKRWLKIADQLKGAK